jgi:hypothetical protein
MLDDIIWMQRVCRHGEKGGSRAYAMAVAGKVVSKLINRVELPGAVMCFVVSITRILHKFPIRSVSPTGMLLFEYTVV